MILACVHVVNRNKAFKHGPRSQVQDRRRDRSQHRDRPRNRQGTRARGCARGRGGPRSEEHTSELQSHLNLVCRLLLEKKKSITVNRTTRAAAALSEISLSVG